MTAWKVDNGKLWYRVGTPLTEKDMEWWHSNVVALVKDGSIHFEYLEDFDPATFKVLDEMTVLRAAKSGCLEFLQWAYTQDPSQFTRSVIDCALKGKQSATAEWLLSLDPPLGKLKQAELLQVDECDLPASVEETPNSNPSSE